MGKTRKKKKMKRNMGETVRKPPLNSDIAIQCLFTTLIDELNGREKGGIFFQKKKKRQENNLIGIGSVFCFVSFIVLLFCMDPTQIRRRGTSWSKVPKVLIEI